MIPLAIPNLNGNEAHYLQQCVDQNFVSTAGPFVPKFEKMVAEEAGSDQAIATSSGTTGLQVALIAAGVKPGDLVVLPSWTFIASANAISHCGASPWLFDVTDESWTLDPKILEHTLSVETEKTDEGLIHIATKRRVAAIMPVYTLGMPAQMDLIMSIAKDWGLPVIADAAAALGANLDAKPIGKMGADLTVLSFNGNKTLTCGGGGAVLGNNEELCSLVRHLTTTARIGDDYDHDRVGFNFRMTNTSAAVGCAQMEKASELVASKQRISARYNDELSNVDGLEPFPSVEWAESACWYSGVLVKAQDHQMGHLISFLQNRGIGCRKFWKPMHLQEPYKDSFASSQRITDEIWQKILTLPCSTSLTEEDQGTVIGAVKEYFS